MGVWGVSRYICKYHYFSRKTIEMLINENVLDWTKEYNGEPFHAMLCDPPYELGFMSKQWDNTGIAFQPETWAALAQHLHPGAFIMAFASTRGFHRQAVAMEDAGLIMHPFITWSFGSGFPKATSISAQCQKNRGVIQMRYGKAIGIGAMLNMSLRERAYWYHHEKANKGHRYGRQALKPAIEPILVFQKPYAGRAVDCITETGAGALWVDGGRVGTPPPSVPQPILNSETGNVYDFQTGEGRNGEMSQSSQGRWPANFILECRCDTIQWCDCDE